MGDLLTALGKSLAVALPCESEDAPGLASLSAANLDAQVGLASGTAGSRREGCHGTTRG